MNKDISQDVLHELLTYNPDTGELRWKVRDVKFFKASTHKSKEQQMRTWNTKYSNTIAFNNTSTHGYKRGGILGKLHEAHRVIWMMQTGEWPKSIDHINGIRTDNRWVNLRNVNKKENNKNRGFSSHNTSGINGVCFSKRTNKWRSRIKVDGKDIYLGEFHDINDAARARKLAEIKYGFHENHGAERINNV